MSKKLICRFKAGMHCYEIAKREKELAYEKDRAKTWNREYHTMLDKASFLALKASELREAKDKVETALTAAKAKLLYYRNAFNVLIIINLILSVGLAAMTMICFWR